LQVIGLQYFVKLNMKFLKKKFYKVILVLENIVLLPQIFFDRENGYDE